MSPLAADMSFAFTFPSSEPATPPSLTFDPSVLELPFNVETPPPSDTASTRASHSPSPARHIAPVRRSPAPPAIRHCGPMLLPKIRSQDQDFESSPPKRQKTASPAPARRQGSSPLASRARARRLTNPTALKFPSTYFLPPTEERASYAQSRSLLASSPAIFDQDSVLDLDLQCGLADPCLDVFGLDGFCLDPSSTVLDKHNFLAPAYAPPTMMTPPPPAQDQPFLFAPYAHLSPPSTLVNLPKPTAAPKPTPPSPTPTTTLLAHLTAPNPAPALVRTVSSYHARDPHTKHFWWDVRQVRPWMGFSAGAIWELPGAAAVLECPVPATLLPAAGVGMGARHPENEAQLHALCAAHYLPRLNAALALSSRGALRFSSGPEEGGVSSSSNGTISGSGEVITLHAATDLSAHPTSSAHQRFPTTNKPTARAVGLVKSYERWNSGMRAPGGAAHAGSSSNNAAVRRVEYLRGLAHLQHAMRERGTRYGFILTEIELVLVRNGGERVPRFGFLEVKVVGLAQRGGGGGGGSGAGSRQSSPASEGEDNGDDEEGKGQGQGKGQEQTPPELTACLALWGLAMLAGDDTLGWTSTSLDSLDAASYSTESLSQTQTQQVHANWHAEIGAPAEGTRRRALPRDAWMPPPQLAEKREAKRARGWVLPEDPVGRKELGRRGVRYGGC